VISHAHGRVVDHISNSSKGVINILAFSELHCDYDDIIAIFLVASVPPASWSAHPFSPDRKKRAKE
jgi:hypothetical protein